ncbi:3-deoxy-manno-octulosonate cytidylyltransferase [Pseudohoeflea coraliihabitans]|uniref:3-deoxy-manno-octulosonate cytidylyltransferase n=1 Tax=Pseudohoeflea coraliihabitans TaxID=2860393 RepID=A0ABS6WQU2_9HYPH|nr:3-deoxy-manno-octulosonate cytidylyltransferase [Pseudohoeflea sp. DP4N28-3]MBW3097767.1 3-deoxy-manno-octulosonate cytidylyltransferase [Pseudohoeflea sp. DP4N28-3]
MASPAGRTVLIIPARMQSTRLPGKPLAMIGDRPMILHVARRAKQAGIGEVVVATDSPRIVECLQAEGVRAVMTRDDHLSGSDRIAEALAAIDGEGTIDTIINVQGDIPAIEPEAIRKVVSPLDNPDVDIATIAVEITDEAEKTNPNIVKVVGTPCTGGNDSGETRLRALYFTRATAPWGDGPLYHHIGLYAYRRAALERFVALPPGHLERRESLEQLRALENGMRIDVAIVDSVPLGVDTPDDLEKARRILGG